MHRANLKGLRLLFDFLLFENIAHIMHFDQIYPLSLLSIFSSIFPIPFASQFCLVFVVVVVGGGLGFLLLFFCKLTEFA